MHKKKKSALIARFIYLYRNTIDLLFAGARAGGCPDRGAGRPGRDGPEHGGGRRGRRAGGGGRGGAARGGGEQTHPALLIILHPVLDQPVRCCRYYQ